jgi:hypothetical protein
MHRGSFAPSAKASLYAGRIVCGGRPGGVRSGFLSFGVHGHDAVFGRGSVLKASTDRFEESVCAEATTAESPPLEAFLR